MCLAVPGRIVDIHTSEGLKMAKVDFGGAVREACLEYVPEAKEGDYVIVHVGFAISLLDEQEARARLDLFRALAEAGGQDETR